MTNKLAVSKSSLEAKAMFREGVTLFLTMLCTVLGVHTVTGADTLGDSADIQTVADWIISLQYTDNPSLPSYGAIKIHHNPGYNAYYRVVPYFSSLGVVGLLRAPVEGKLEMAERWMNWYLSHLNANGTVYDHWYLADGTGETTSPPGCDTPGEPNCDWDDASDSYAATFLGVAWAYYEEGGRSDFLKVPGNKEKFETIAGVILALQQADGLTWAKDSFHVKYLMDNSEVYWGLKSMAHLEADVFGDTIAAQTYEDAAEQVRNGIKTELFNPSAELYRIAKFEDGTLEEANLNEWYPGTVALVWPHLFGVTGPQSIKKAQAQMAALNDSWDGLPNPDWKTNIVDPNGFPWTSVGYAALLAGGRNSARNHANSVKDLKLPTFDWQFTVSDAGWLLRTFSTPLPMGQLLEFQDNFETNKGWSIFEEIVGDNLCYDEDIGEVDRSIDVALNGSYSLRVWANKAKSTKSNHVIAQKRVSYSGQTGRWRYELYAYIDPETGGTGQTGPEFSMQNTREVAPGEFRTSIAGMQYQVSPYAPQLGSWAIWREHAPGQASWHVFMTQPLVPGEWYYIAVEVDYRTNKYVHFWLHGSCINLSFDLSGYSIAQEEKFNEEAFWISLESENLWSNCKEAFDYRVYYDDVKLQHGPHKIVLSPDPIDFGDVIVGRQYKVTLEIGNDGDADLNITNIFQDLGENLVIDPSPPYEPSLTVAPNATTTVTLTFTVSVEGEINGTLTIESNDPRSPTEIKISAVAKILLGDLSGDGSVSAYDASLILQFVVGLITEFPIESMMSSSPYDIGPRDYEISISDVTVKQGERIQVPIVINDATGLHAGGIVVKYDSNVLKAIDVMATGTLSSSYWERNINRTDEVRFAFASMKPIESGNKLFILEFSALPNTEGVTSPLTLDYVNLSESLSITKKNGSITVLPSQSLLLQNYPNPFNPETCIPFQLSAPVDVVISIYDIDGQLVKKIGLTDMPAGVYIDKDRAIYWNGCNNTGEKVASGVYFYHLQAGSYSATKRMLIVK